MNNKVEAIVILTGIIATIVVIGIHLVRKAKESNVEKTKSLETISAIKESRIDDTKSNGSVILSGTLDPSEFNKEVRKERSTKNAKKKDSPVFQDYLVEEDKELLRRAERNEGDFLTSMLIADATDSALIGTIVGGDPVGAIVGDIMNDSDSHTSTDFSDSPTNDSTWDTTDSSSWSSDSSSDWSSSDSTSTDW